MVSLVLAASLYRSQDSHSVLVYLGKQLPSPLLKSVSHLRRTEGAAISAILQVPTIVQPTSRPISCSAPLLFGTSERTLG